MSNLSRRSPFSLSHWHDELFPSIEREFDQLLASFFGDQSVVDTIKASPGYPKLDISEENGQWIVRASVPGVDPKNVKVEIIPPEREVGRDLYTMKISGEMSKEHKIENADYRIRELHKGKFCREITIPDYIEGDPTAAVKDGILTLKWNKKKEPAKPQPKVVEVKVE